MKLIEIISLQTPKDRLIVIFTGFLVLLITPIEKLSYLPIFSLYEELGLYNYLGFEFYSAGITRSISSILHLNFDLAYTYNPLGFVFVFVLIIIVIRDLFLVYKKK